MKRRKCLRKNSDIIKIIRINLIKIIIKKGRPLVVLFGFMVAPA